MIVQTNELFISGTNNSLSFRDYEDNPYSRNKFCLKTS